MSQHEFGVDPFVHAGGTLAVHGGEVRGLIIETDDIHELRSELYRIVPRLLVTNHGLSRDAEPLTSTSWTIDPGQPPRERSDSRREPPAPPGGRRPGKSPGYQYRSSGTGKSR